MIISGECADGVGLPAEAVRQPQRIENCFVGATSKVGSHCVGGVADEDCIAAIVPWQPSGEVVDVVSQEAVFVDCGNCSSHHGAPVSEQVAQFSYARRRGALGRA